MRQLPCLLLRFSPGPRANAGAAVSIIQIVPFSFLILLRSTGCSTGRPPRTSSPPRHLGEIRPQQPGALTTPDDRCWSASHGSAVLRGGCGQNDDPIHQRKSSVASWLVLVEGWGGMGVVGVLLELTQSHETSLFVGAPFLPSSLSFFLSSSQSSPFSSSSHSPSSSQFSTVAKKNELMNEPFHLVIQAAACRVGSCDLQQT